MKGLMIKKRFLVMLLGTVLMLSANVVADDHADGMSEPNNEVRTSLEQRMKKKISINFRDTPIDDVIRAMAEQADVDVIKSPKVTGNVTATLTDVPLDEALTSILESHGFGYVMSRNMIRIAPLLEITERSERLVSRIYRITYADVEDVEKALKKFISKRGSLSSNPGTSNVIVTDTESKIKAIDTFIEEIDRITPQILVEARIYDITSKDKLDLGVDWAAGTNTTFTGGVGTNPTAGDSDPFMTGGFSGETEMTSSVTGALRFGWLNDNIDIDVLIKAQKNEINAKLLANPRISVLDNETAAIKIISEIPYIELTETSSGGSMGTTAFREIGVTLMVTPHLTRDNMIRLRLSPEFSVQTGTVNVGSVSAEYPQPVVDRRVAQTTLLVKDGQTVVLGGLRKKDITQQINKVPLLGDLPVAGEIFKFQGEDTVMSELVVFITPRLIVNPMLSETEQIQYAETEFLGPSPQKTRGEKRIEKETGERLNDPNQKQ